MLSFKQSLLALIALVFVSACGFTPVYGPGGSATKLQNRILVDEPQDRNAFWLTQRIEEKLGRASDPKYGLNVVTTIVEQDIAVDQQGDISRYDLLGRAEYTLRDLKTEKVVYSGVESNFIGYSASGTPVATLASERDAYERLMISLADQIVNRLISTIDPGT